MTHFPAAPHGRNAGKPAKSTAAFNALKRDIMLGVLPAGTALTELDLAAHFSCSQGTVREALLQLQEEGLVRRQGHRGTQVSECTAAEAIEMFRVRQQIECNGIIRVLRAPSRNLVPDLRALLAEMMEAAGSGDELELASFDRDFHRRIFQDARLPALDPILHRCLVHNHRFKISRSTTPRDLMATAQRHGSIIDAIESGDVARTSAALRHHIATIVDLGPDVFPDASQ
ncbi:MULTISPECIES: GntR family transcriptional regulator [unclassified Sinorhizobium]|uniref:GntR family transcriptional regulator n=1 Tax=unclassified Sinorhizobium TaxID=2613772 RepID=UPI0024C24FBD|nr:MULTISPECIES: GntR family transcriptional regulator [unclassified Sinorhizobium]MDK1374102.1 GntR family transcriptional regulator [Sinorhizobium sp. 6-70]MDK1477842.1 GntR family transcriptional regulator [Sinorhizobium sp. 6-117]